MKQQHKYREALQQRSISPSESSWEQLSQKLDAHENFQKGKKWLFLKYAATILVFISVGFYFFQPKSEIISEDKIVSPTSKDKMENEPILNSKPAILIADIEKLTPAIQKKSKIKVEIAEIEKNKDVVVFENVIAKNTTISEEIRKQNNPTVIASNSDVTDTEIEQLLKNANINLKEKCQSFNKKSVSAQALLVEVEDDLDKDFKEKLIETITKTLKSSKEIVITDRGN